MDNRPSPSCLKPQSVLKWEVRCENRFLIFSKKTLIFTSKVWTVLHLASFWEWGSLELRNGLLCDHLTCVQSCVYVTDCAVHMVALVLNGASVTALVTVFVWTSIYSITTGVRVSRKVVGKSARDNPERYCGWFWVLCSWKKIERVNERPWTYVWEC